MTKASVKRNSIRSAIMMSLDHLVRSREKVTQTAVIAGAVREDGSPIGKTTLYSRNANTKEYVHADLIKEIDLAIAKQRNSRGKKTKAETIQGLKDEKKSLKEENQMLVDQVVSQQDKIRVLSLSGSRERGGLDSGEDDTYVLSAVLNEVTQGAIQDVKRVIAQYTDKHAGSERIRLASLSVERYLREIENSRLVTLKQPEMPKSISKKLNL